MNIGSCTAYVAELWGILKGMEASWSKGIKKIVIDSDSASIINSLKHINSEGNRNKFLMRIKLWQDKEWEV